MYETYKLYRLKNVFDDYGQLKEEYEVVDVIDVQVGYKNVVSATGEVIYNTYYVTGLTNYNNFIPKAKYKLINEEHEYIIETTLPFYKKTVLNLKEVL